MATRSEHFRDLRPICRDPDTHRCVVYLVGRYGGNREAFLRLGQVNLRTQDNARSQELTARMADGTTDFEHSSAYVMWLPLIGTGLDLLNNGLVWLSAWINPDVTAGDDFLVPAADYDPRKHPGTKMCEHCDEPHLIVPENFFTPEANLELFDELRGRRVEIVIGPTAAFNEEENSG